MIRDTQEKADREVAVFLDFLARSGLSISPESVQKRHPPEPDILCEHSLDGPTAFELIELCDELVAETFSEREPEPASAMWLDGPNLGKVATKFTKLYATNAPIELLCYTSGRLVTPDSVLIPMIHHELDFSTQTKFQRVWYMGEQQVTLLYDAR